MDCNKNLLKVLKLMHNLHNKLRADGNEIYDCQYVMRNFNHALNQLDIHNLWLSSEALVDVRGGHVVNILVFKHEDGRVFSYALDVGWNRKELYPTSIDAIQFHDTDADGIIENTTLPQI